MRQRIASRQAGVTLIELIFTLVIFAVLASIGLPPLGQLIDKARARGAGSALTTSLSLARMTAVSRHLDVVVCPSSNHATCDNGVWWQHGWIAFEDLDHDGKRSGKENLLEIVDAQSSVAIATSAGRKYVTYRDDGTSAGTNLTYTLCDRRGAAQATTFVINNGGRVRQGTPTAAQAAAACAGL
jgi:type IV fimbrial biogenesis protein FimT